jgi:hypothetical protein
MSTLLLIVFLILPYISTNLQWFKFYLVIVTVIGLADAYNKEYRYRYLY